MGREQRRKQSIQSASTIKRGPSGLPANYRALLDDLKGRIRSAQIRAGLAVNRELIQLYWDIGRAIAVKQEAEGWGAKVIDRLGADLQREFPGMAGFSRTNIYRMCAFYQTYSPKATIVSRAARQRPDEIVPQAVGQLKGRAVVPQPVGRIGLTTAILQPPIGELPWGHNVLLLEKLKENTARLWYAQQAITNGWSRSMLEHWIDSDLYSRQSKAITNFSTALPPAQSDLAQQILKDSYNFDFLTLRADAAERQLEEGLIEHIRRFLIELGAGFAFVGQQIHLEIDGEDFYIDLLFYHLRLRCFVVIDLKTGRFKPEYAGKMNFYLSAVDDRMRHADDGPSIGLILCKTRSKVIAEYALRHLQRPVGVARYITELTEKLPSELMGSLPTVKQIEAELARTSRQRDRQRAM